MDNPSHECLDRMTPSLGLRPQVQRWRVTCRMSASGFSKHCAVDPGPLPVPLFNLNGHVGSCTLNSSFYRTTKFTLSWNPGKKCARNNLLDVVLRWAAGEPCWQKEITVAFIAMIVPALVNIDVRSSKPMPSFSFRISHLALIKKFLCCSDKQRQKRRMEQPRSAMLGGERELLVICLPKDWHGLFTDV